MIFVTGDTHRLKDVLKLDNVHFPEQEMLSRRDYLIIAGDFGSVWTGDERDDEALDYHENKNYTTLFVAGNHENYDLLDAYPTEEWNGGLIHRIREHVIHLMNGQIYTINGKKFFVMGGATSIDKMFRREGVSWWPQEEPSSDVFSDATWNLMEHNNTVDYIVTHTCPEKVRKNAFEVYNDFIEYTSGVEQYLDFVLDHVTYSKWFTGHIHIDREFPDYRLRVLYNGVVKL